MILQESLQANKIIKFYDFIYGFAKVLACFKYLII